MSDPTKDKNTDTKDAFQKPFHTYTPRSHEELLRKYSTASKKSTDLKYFRRENDDLKRELNSSNRQLERLQQRVKILEEKNGLNRGVHSSGARTLSKPEYEVEVDTDDEYSQSWVMLGDHFSEVIRRHQEEMAEKDRLIRELQESKCSGESSKRRSSTPTREDASQTGCSLDEASKDGMEERGSFKLKNNKAEEREINNADSSTSCHCADDCCFAVRPVSLKDCVINSGEILSEHFSEVIRRHKEQLQEKDMQIQELQEALACCVGGKSMKRSVEPEVQMWTQDYFCQPQPCVGRDERTRGERRPSLDEDDSSGASTDTFIALEKCQRLESIANLERLREHLMERLKLEEKLDKLYWQTELKRYQRLREEAGDHFDPNCAFNKDFEMLEITRLELLRALKEVNESGEREPEIYVKPHSILRDSECSVDDPTFPESEKKRRVTFIEQCTVTEYPTKCDSDYI